MIGRWILITVCGLSIIGAELVPRGESIEDLRQGLMAVRRSSEAEDYLAALARSEALLGSNDFAAWRSEEEREDSSLWLPLLELFDPAIDSLRLGGYTRNERGAIYYALGVVFEASQERDAARQAFEKARARAGDGELRLDAAYNLGTLTLLQGEEWRQQIPEIAGDAAAPLAPVVPPDPNAAPPEEEPDPLEQARGAYLQALEHLAQRLRLDWRDGDTRANIELVLRRLKELDEIEQQREEQQQEQDQQDEQEQEEQQEDQESEENQEEGDENEEPQEPEEGDENEQEPDPAEDEPEEEPEEQPEPDPNEPEEGETSEEETQVEEIFLTKEEVQRLLDRLQKHEEEGLEIRQRLHQKRRRSTDRDW